MLPARQHTPDARNRPYQEPNHSRTNSVWGEIFRRSNIRYYPCVADLCPGDDPKVESGLAAAGFRGSLIAVDSSEPRLRKLSGRLGDAGFSFVPRVSKLEAASFPDCDAIAGNHIIDDLLTSSYALRKGLSYEEVYRRSRADPEYSRGVWHHISADAAAREEVLSLLERLVRSSPAALVVFSHYASKYERAHDMHHETAACIETLADLSRRLEACGDYISVPWLQDALGRPDADAPEKWAVLKRAKFQAIELQLTTACNLSCLHCCAHPDKLLMMDASLARTIADSFPLVGTKVGFTGGEPFLNPRIREMLECFFRRGARLSLTTNGTTDGSHLDGLLREFGVKVKVSLHGTEQTHSFITGSATAFQKSIATIRRLVAAGVKVAIQTSIHRQVRHSPEMMVDLCHSLGVLELKVFPLIDQGAARASGWSQRHQLSDTEYSSALFRMRARASLLESGIDVRECRWPNSGHYVLINPAGDVSANPVKEAHGRLIIGNVRTSNPAELWGAYPFKSAHFERYA
jgi:MoaA/NifB/PqqE/SkfB family radical SAM enzyme